MITVSINKESISVKEQTTLQEVVLTKLNHIDQSGIAVALNERVMQKSDWNSTILNNNDNILIIKATQGG
jgi:sulfur carrier protein